MGIQHSLREESKAPRSMFLILHKPRNGLFLGVVSNSGQECWLGQFGLDGGPLLFSLLSC